MNKHDLSRRQLLQYGSAALTGMSLFSGLGFPQSVTAQAGD